MDIQEPYLSLSSSLGATMNPANAALGARVPVGLEVPTWSSRNENQEEQPAPFPAAEEAHVLPIAAADPWQYQDNEDVYYMDYTHGVVPSAGVAAAAESDYQNSDETREEEKHQQPSYYQLEFNDTMLATAREGLQQALDSLLAQNPQEIRYHAYRDVKKWAPHLIELESPFDRYLMYHECNYWQAAATIMEYWHVRKQIFGPHQYWKPMRLTKDPEHETALSPVVAHLILTSESHYVLPELDAEFRPVLLIDRGQFWHFRGMAPPFCFDNKEEIRGQIFFYFLQSASESEYAIRNGVVAVIAMESPAMYQRQKTIKKSLSSRMKGSKTDDGALGAATAAALSVTGPRSPHAEPEDEDSPPRMPLGAKALRRPIMDLVQAQIFPGRAEAVHVIAVRDQAATTSTRLFDSLLNILLSVINLWKFLALRLKVHCYRDTPPEDVARDLCDPNNKNGLTPNHIVARFGGTAPHCDTWLAQRKQVEQERYACLDRTNYKEEHEDGRKQPAKPNGNQEPQDHCNQDGIHRRKRQLLEEQDVDAEQVMVEARQKIAKLEREQNQLHRSHVYLQAQLVCTQRIESQYLKDRQRIHAFLKGIFVSMLSDKNPTKTNLSGLYAQLRTSIANFGRPSTSDKNEDSLTHAAVDRYLTTVLEFQGRNIYTGQWIFQPLYRTTLEGQYWGARYPQARSGSMELEQSLRGAQDLLTEYESDAEDDESIGSQDSLLDDQCDYNQMSLCAMHDKFLALEDCTKSLNSKKQNLQEKRNFLRSALIMARHLQDGFEEYKRQNRDELAAMVEEHISTSSQTAVSSREDRCALTQGKNVARDPHAIADRLLMQEPWRGESQVCINPSILTMVGQGSEPQDLASFGNAMIRNVDTMLGGSVFSLSQTAPSSGNASNSAVAAAASIIMSNGLDRDTAGLGISSDRVGSRREPSVRDRQQKVQRRRKKNLKRL